VVRPPGSRLPDTPATTLATRTVDGHRFDLVSYLDTAGGRRIGWLDLRAAPGEPATRIRLDPRDPQIPAPEVTVTRTAHSPGELLLDVIAARILTSTGAVPQDNPGPLASAGLRAFVGDGPGHIVAALQAAGALPPSSPAPGQLAGLCARLGIPGHGITVPPAAGLPERWLSMLTHRRKPEVTPAPGSWAATAAELPEVDGVRLAVLGLYQAEHGTILHLHAGGVTMEDDWEYHRAVRPLPALWIRDHAGRWHATCHYAPRSLGERGEVTLELAITPPLEAGTRRSTWRPPGHRPRSRPGCRSAGRGIHDSDPSRLPHLGRTP
jgi:hypothetical protein